MRSEHGSGRRDPESRESSGKAQGGATAPEAGCPGMIQGSPGTTDGAQDGRILTEAGEIRSGAAVDEIQSDPSWK